MNIKLQQTETAPGSRILAMGAARGELAVTNNELVAAIDSSDEWIQQRTGIVTRKRAKKGTSALDLAVSAAQEAITKSGVDPVEIGLVIVATISNVQQTPSLAAVLADKVGAINAAAYDSNAACAGYCYGIAQADAMIRSGQAKYAVVIGAEKLSDVVDPSDRSISFLLGDGAGAAVLGAASEPGVSTTVWGADGSRAAAVGMNNTLIEFRDGEAAWPTLRQDGSSVFRWAVWEMAKVARKTMEAAGIEAKDLTAFVPHQANMRIIDEFAKQLGLPESVLIARDIRETGNTSAASIPLAMHQLLAENPEASGGLALQIGFGAGLVYASQVVRLP
ncbi:ketoacyl-ACP synthase III [Canibacter sp. lx-45]|uniref:beta-ketoacyl-ACP synthase III n=1 Tax=Canibacter zhuwentaonis TaxID=2837491 RepID=UPI001BDBF7CA|nr:beta-ketoacyl-ACP synthase III [Canibacter zhuwentaonis]MBT1035650.1 ketoacyl-ACP synthase III [Canibacter zhuwentaonis]